MNRKKNSIFVTTVQENKHNYEYLGSDGLPIDDSYDIYHQKCSEFIAKSRKYKENNKNIKNSLLHQVKYGFDNSMSLEEKIFNERKEHTDYYIKTFNVTHFTEDQNAMYETTTGQSKRIRIIRDLEEEREIKDFTENFKKETSKWFSRYCVLSKFIQSARIIIILNRFKKNLEILKRLTPEDILKFQTEDA